MAWQALLGATLLKHALEWSYPMVGGGGKLDSIVAFRVNTGADLDLFASSFSIHLRPFSDITMQLFGELLVVHFFFASISLACRNFG